MHSIDIEYAREIFTDLIIASMVKTNTVISPVETEVFANRAIALAMSFRLAYHAATQNEPHSTPKGQQTQHPATANLANVAREWMKRSGVARRRHKSVAIRMERYVLPYLGAKALRDIAPREVLSVVRAIEDAGHAATAYGVFRDICSLYRYAIASGLTEHDPTMALRRVINVPQGKGTRMSTHYDSIGRLLVAIQDYKGQPVSTARFLLRLAPMLFLRPTELRTLEWREVDLNTATIAIPDSRMKMRRAHIVPLPSQAVRILRTVQAMTGDHRYVFNAGRGIDTPLTEGIFYVILRNLGFGGTATPHGFRVLASTWLHEQGWPHEVIERQLSHLGDDRARRIYNRAEYMPQRRKMMQAWADHLEHVAERARQELRKHHLPSGGVHASA